MTASFRRNWRSRGARYVPSLLAGSALILAACSGKAARAAALRGNPDAGKVAIAAYGCGACHTVPGIRDARGLVGPPLDHFARRGFIAGQLPNTFDNLVRWIESPQSVEPGTAMPYLGVPEPLARNIAAYLYTLQ